MKQTRAKVMEILRDWAESELRAKPIGYAGNPRVELKLSCNDIGCGVEDLVVDLAPLADRLVETLERVA